MSGSRQTQDYYDEFSQTYERGRDRGYHALVDRLEIEIALKYARGRVLEIGCGTGLILRRLHNAAQAVGIDLSRGMIEHAQGRSLSVLRASATALPFRDGSFDMACSFKVLAHVEDVERAVAEAARVVRSGGHVVLEFYNRRSLRYVAFSLRRGAISARTTEKDVFVRYDRLADIRRYLPSSLRMIALRGVRVVTPAASLLRWPLVGPALERIERGLADAPVLRRLGGFLVVVAKRE